MSSLAIKTKKVPPLGIKALVNCARGEERSGQERRREENDKKRREETG